MEAASLCRCCLLRPPDKDLRTSYLGLGTGIPEVYMDMLEKCFEIHVILGIEGECGICKVCVGRLRDANDFKLQVQRSQVELQARLAVLLVKDEEPEIKLETVENRTSGVPLPELLSENGNDRTDGDMLDEGAIVKSESADISTNDVLSGAVGPEAISEEENDRMTRDLAPEVISVANGVTNSAIGLHCTTGNADSVSSVGCASECYDSDRDAIINPDLEKSSSTSSDEEETTADMEHAEFQTSKEPQASTSRNKANKQKYKVKKSSSDLSDEESINNTYGEEQFDISEEHQVQTPSTATDEYRQKSARIRTKDFCFFCETEVLNFARHVFRNHALEAEVQTILSYSKKSCTRKNLLTNLRKKGNYIASVSKCVKPMKKSDLHNDYLPCVNCLGFYSRKQLWKHKKTCQPMSKTSHSQFEAQNFMLRNLNVEKKLKEEVFCKMRPDRVSLEAMKDSLICEFGAQYLRINREKHLINLTLRKMRELAKLLIELKRLKPGLKDLMDSLKPQNYDIIVTATKTVASYDSKLDRYGAPTYAINISTSLKQCCNIAFMNILKSGSTVQTASMQADFKTLIQLIEANWKFDVSSQACSDLHLKEWNKIASPLASDLKRLKDHLCDSAKTAASKLSVAESTDVEAYITLMETVYCRMILLNLVNCKDYYSAHTRNAEMKITRMKNLIAPFLLLKKS